MEAGESSFLRRAYDLVGDPPCDFEELCDFVGSHGLCLDEIAGEEDFVCRLFALMNIVSELREHHNNIGCRQDWNYVESIIISCFQRRWDSSIFSQQQLNEDVVEDLYDVFCSMTPDNQITLVSRDMSEIRNMDGFEIWVPNMHKSAYGSCLVDLTSSSREHTIMNNTVISIVQIKEEEYNLLSNPLNKKPFVASGALLENNTVGRPQGDPASSQPSVTPARRVQDDDDGSVAINANSDISDEGSMHESDREMFDDDSIAGSQNQAALNNRMEAEEDERLRAMYQSDDDEF